MTERKFSLDDVTTAMAPALAQAKARHGGNPDRALDLFCQGVIDGLKALQQMDDAEALASRPGTGTYQGADGKRHPIVPLASPND